MADIEFTDVTTGDISGTGVFDKLQKSLSAQLDKEYKLNRIKGPEYSEVYLGGMQSAMQQAISFVLAEQTAGHEADLTAAKVITEGLQQDKLTAEIAHIEEQTKLVTAQIAKTEAETAILGKALEEAEAKIWIAKAQVSDDLTITTPPVDLIASGGILGRTAEKLDSEVGLLTEKKKSESAQTADVAVSNSVIGKEILLRDRQADGFLRDAEQKLAKIAADAFAVQFTTLDGLGEGGVLPSQFTSGGISEIINKAKDGVFNP